MDLKTDEMLERSAIVANCRMNRERELFGSNGYDRELRLDFLERLREVAKSNGRARWLDLCCGSGRALIEAAGMAAAEGVEVEIIGVDLVGMFLPYSVTSLPTLCLVEASLRDWSPDGPVDVITCVHGLHYIGDKLGLLERAASWLADDGELVANLDLANLNIEGFRYQTDTIRLFSREGFVYHPGQHLLSREGGGCVAFGFDYLGADDGAGPNYTGQEAVNSHYRS